jgi:hypothetical protein
MDRDGATTALTSYLEGLKQTLTERVKWANVPRFHAALKAVKALYIEEKPGLGFAVRLQDRKLLIDPEFIERCPPEFLVKRVNDALEVLCPGFEKKLELEDPPRTDSIITGKEALKFALKNVHQRIHLNYRPDPRFPQLRNASNCLLYDPVEDTVKIIRYSLVVIHVSREEWLERYAESFWYYWGQ